MERNFHIHSSNLHELENHNYAEQPFFKVTGEFVETGFDAQPIEGYEAPKDFPNCCPYHSSILSNAKDWFGRFPHCCEGHKALLQKHWFHKATYSNVPEKIVRQASYTEYFIEKNIESEDWYKDITDYIEYIVVSFGSPSIGAERYLANVTNYVKNGKMSFWTPFKRQRTLEYVTQLHTVKEPENQSKSDLNTLYQTFQKWLKILPDISLFTDMKARLLNKVPMEIMTYDEVYNPFLGLSKFKVKTQGELIEWLADFTRQVLSSVNSAELVKAKVISDVNAHEFDLISEEHKIVQARLLGKFSEGELAYVDIIKNWLTNEAAYFGRIKEYANGRIKSSKSTRRLASPKTKILFMTSNPRGEDSLRLEDELRKVKDEIQQSTKRELLELVSEGAVKVQTVTRALQQHKPKIVHFSGHGSGNDGLAVQDDAGNLVLFPSVGLDKLFKLHKTTVKCVLLNACYSHVQAELISKHGIYVVGMNDEIGDQAALDFAVGFYQSIGEGKGYRYAFENALVNISPSLDNANTPELWYKGQMVA